MSPFLYNRVIYNARTSKWYRDGIKRYSAGKIIKVIRCSLSLCYRDFINATEYVHIAKQLFLTSCNASCRLHHKFSLSSRRIRGSLFSLEGNRHDIYTHTCKYNEFSSTRHFRSKL